MGFLGKFFAGLFGSKSSSTKTSGDMGKATGAGPAMAAHQRMPKHPLQADKTQKQPENRSDFKQAGSIVDRSPNASTTRWVNG
ncbi:hypothetical protein [Mesorhizobium sp. M7A.F.Ca.US.008.03.1.1]|uniref:hypothetical protein n=1 Tax=Mesorhizobium sp. M7A.F.Ca.US.008.03.1.1 TaxID=2496742 RepID=UPI0013DEA04D|nr:hypothetical protein [Mesorhizobium sp. M7A.F.Ca.US.008.03.1.1]